jgi:hypothetical protein
MQQMGDGGWELGELGNGAMKSAVQTSAAVTANSVVTEQPLAAGFDLQQLATGFFGFQACGIFVAYPVSGAAAGGHTSIQQGMLAPLGWASALASPMQVAAATGAAILASQKGAQLPVAPVALDSLLDAAGAVGSGNLNGGLCAAYRSAAHSPSTAAAAVAPGATSSGASAAAGALDGWQGKVGVRGTATA